MPSVIRLASALCDHLLELVPAPARAKRLDDIVDAEETEQAPLAADPPSGVRQAAHAAIKRAAS